MGKRVTWGVFGCLLALAVSVGGCTRDVPAPSTTQAPPPTAATTTSTTVDPELERALPLDPAVVTGQLDNGLAYYIAENDSPGGRVELRLLVDAGSVQEDEDQAGMAHFLEHMMFNGTEAFPKNELITVLESFGPRFGPDINASTSYDETIYELSLTTDPQLIELGMNVLREWAGRATLTQADVSEERGVVLDEWRLRAQGLGARISEEIETLILPGSPYEGHDPIGTPDSITAADRETLVRYYTDWYRPDRMAVVAVGDVDESVIEDLIADVFGDLEPRTPAPTWEAPEFAPPVDVRAATLADQEAALASVSVIWPMSQPHLATVGDYQRAVAETLGLGILADRLRDDSTTADSPMLGAGAVDYGWTRQIGVRGLEAEVRVDRVEEGLEAVLVEIERMRRHGIDPAEFDDAIDGFEVVIDQTLQQQESTQDVEIVQRIIGHHLSGAPLMSATQRFEVESGIVERLSMADVEAALASMLVNPPAILVTGPDDPDVMLPSDERILTLWGGLSDLTLDPRPPLDGGEEQLMEAPDPVEPISKETDPRFGYTTLVFGNGATVYLWESDIAAGSVHAEVEGFGGTSLVDADDLTEAFAMTEILGRSGIAGFDPPELRRLLSDRLVSVSPWISETRQGIYGDASIDDVEWLFQMIHLIMTRPRLDQTAADAVIEELRTLDASREDLPDLLFQEAVDRLYYGGDPRYFTIPSRGDLDDFDLDTASRIFRERFSDASGFAFAFVGDFDPLVMSDLAARYIGTLGGSGRPGSYIDNQPLPARRAQVEVVEAGIGEQGQIGMFFTNQHEPVLRDRVAARLAVLILDSRLRERIREELGATYSISADIDLQRDPDPFAESYVISTGDPHGLEQISGEILAELERLRAGGPTDAEMATAVEQLRNEMDLIDNPLLAGAVITAYLYPDQPVSELADRYDLVGAITKEDVRRIVSIAFDPGQRIEVRLVSGS